MSTREAVKATAEHKVWIAANRAMHQAHKTWQAAKKKHDEAQAALYETPEHKAWAKNIYP